MMADRGYQIPDHELQLEKVSDLSVGAYYLSVAKKAKCSIGYSLSCTYARNNQSTLVFFVDNNYDESKRREKMVSTEQAKAAITLWKQSFADCAHCILVCPGKLSPDAKKESTITNLTILTHEFLLMPVGRHILVPKHEGLSESDASVFLKSRKIESGQLPHLKVNDPISLYYGFEPGTIVKISRPGWTVFRVVVS
jgi:DNA-directed RNA polymerase I, II, and III subunit RPABC1